MANLDAPRGFWPIRNLNGDSVFPTNAYYMTAASTIYVGDAVQMANTGLVLAAAASTENIVGVAAETITSPASSTSTKIMVYDSPHTVFGVQTVTGTSFTQTMVGNTAVLTATAGSATNGHSLMEAGIGTVAASISASVAQMKILRLIERVDNALGEHADIEIVWAAHQNSNNAPGI